MSKAFPRWFYHPTGVIWKINEQSIKTKLSPTSPWTDSTLSLDQIRNIESVRELTSSEALEILNKEKGKV